jgi:hypothetical protein
LEIQISSTGKNNKEKFINSKKAWINEQPFYQDKIQRLFHPLVNFFEKSRDTNFQKSNGTISETVQFITDSAYNTSQDGLLKFTKTLSKTHQIDRIEKYFNIHSLKDEVVTNSLKTVGKAQVKAEAIVSQSMGIYKAQEILESKTSELNDLVDEGVIHITSDVTRLSLGDGRATRSIGYIFINE